MPPGFDFGRVEGMLLGLAIGDALGNTSEGMLPSQRAAYHGEIRDYLPNRYAAGRRVGLPSDDSQLAFWTLEQLIADRGFDPENLAVRFSQGQIFGIGQSVREFLANYKSGLAWYASGPESAGNGALMRIAPMLIPHLRTGTAGLWADVALSSMITHNDSASNAACVAFVYMLWQLRQMSRSLSLNGGCGPMLIRPRRLRREKHTGRAAAGSPTTKGLSGNTLKSEWVRLGARTSRLLKPATPGTRVRSCLRRCPVSFTS